MIAMNTPENVSNSNPSTTTRIGWRSGLATLIFGIVVTVTVNRLTPDNTYRMIRNFYCVGGTYFAMIAWWILFSGFTLKTRLVTLVLLGIVGFGGLYLSIRKIDFDGDMRPRVQFTWDPPSSSEQAQKWLSENAPTTPQDASTTEASTILEITDADWPRYCGATGDRIIAEPQCSFDWKTNPPRELWRHPVGDAWSSFAVVGSRLFTQEQQAPWNASSVTKLRLEKSCGGEKTRLAMRQLREQPGLVQLRLSPPTLSSRWERRES
jgi:outer membrane protein assembly factor BamB